MPALRMIAAALAAILLSLLIPAPAGAADAPAGTVKVYVVPAGDRDESLAAIAERTLGDPARAGEILALNQARPQPDGGALTAAGDTPRPGWVLQLPDDADGPEVRLARPATPVKPFWNPALILSLIGAVLLGLLTVGVLARRPIARRYRAVAVRVAARREAKRHRAAQARLRTRLGAEIRDDAGAPRVSGPAGVEVFGLLAAPGETTAFVGTSAPPPAGWTADAPGTWRRAGGPDRHAASPDGAALPVRVGGTGDELLVLDLSWLDGALAVGGDPEVATSTLATILTETTRRRPGLRIVAVAGPDADPRLVPPGVHRVPDVAALAGLIPGPAGPGATGVMRDAARRRRLTGLIVVAHPLGADEAGRLAWLCDGPGGWAALVRGDAPGAFWSWYAGPDGEVRIPWLDRVVTVPSPVA
ncbi:hypothetical protein J2S43_001219 [Catenuloplanes nepalensis]|uniref:Uncharacterized protein n=1 Tax=Catenuloplanes nepalensis TaxID=587533 RepID=A0ABT9MMR8_9ACTN|nr:hypothetical protein [Catenuloplanes nepalensis]MDP9792707.1 hypothetical protein [Catenuloplanes nepalensis]